MSSPLSCHLLCSQLTPANRKHTNPRPCNAHVRHPAGQAGKPIVVVYEADRLRQGALNLAACRAQHAATEWGPLLFAAGLPPVQYHCDRVREPAVARHAVACAHAQRPTANAIRRGESGAGARRALEMDGGGGSVVCFGCG